MLGWKMRVTKRMIGGRIGYCCPTSMRILKRPPSKGVSAGPRMKACVSVCDAGSGQSSLGGVPQKIDERTGAKLGQRWEHVPCLTYRPDAYVVLEGCQLDVRVGAPLQAQELLPQPFEEGHGGLLVRAFKNL